MIRGPASCLGSDPVKSQFRQIEFINKDVDHLNGIVLVDPVFQAFRKQRALPTIPALNEAPHPILLRIISRESHKRGVFTQPGSFATEAMEALRPWMSASRQKQTLGD